MFSQTRHDVKRAVKVQLEKGHRQNLYHDCKYLQWLWIDKITDKFIRCVQNFNLFANTTVNFDLLASLYHT